MVRDRTAIYATKSGHVYLIEGIPESFSHSAPSYVVMTRRSAPSHNLLMTEVLAPMFLPYRINTAPCPLHRWKSGYGTSGPPSVEHSSCK